MPEELKSYSTVRLNANQEHPTCEGIPPHTDVPRTVVSYGITDVGLVRDHNEDSYSLLNLVGKSLYIVADGMGGHDAGEVASKIAVETVNKVVRSGNGKGNNNSKLLEEAVLQANIDVREEGMFRESDMGTTLSAVLVADGVAFVANVGDSRVYWIENGSITQVTTDHSLVAKLVTAGKLTREEARYHPRANLLYRTIGSAQTLKIDIFRVLLKKGGTLLLCSDGLWGEVADEDICRVCAEERDATAAAMRLVRMANENGGKDNITVVIAKIG